MSTDCLSKSVNKMLNKLHFPILISVTNGLQKDSQILFNKKKVIQ